MTTTTWATHGLQRHNYRMGPGLFHQNLDKAYYTGCLQLLKILEISWNLIGPPGNFCVRCQRSTALVSSHKNMDKCSLQKYEIYRHQMCFFMFHMHHNPFSAGAPPRTSVGELMTLPEIPIQLGILWVFQLSEGGRSKANMSWIFLKIPPGISWKFA